MVPILRTILVGGVFIALLLIALARSPQDHPHPQVVKLGALARPFDDGALPPWHRFVAQAAFVRATRAQDLRAFVPRGPMADGSVATLRVSARDDDASAVRGITSAAAEATVIPVDIGEASSTELPVVPHEETPPIVSPRVAPVERAAPPERKTVRVQEPPVTEIKPRVRPQEPPEIKPRARAHHRIYHRRRAKRAPEPAHFNLLQALFGTHEDKPRNKTARN